MPDQTKLADSGVSNFTIDKTKLAMGAAIVALSGFVPQPMMQQAHADTTNMDVAGSFSAGIDINFVANADFGTVVPTASTGHIILGTGPAVSGVGHVAIAGSAIGSLTMDYAAGGQSFTITVAGMGSFNPAANGTATLEKVFFYANGAAPALAADATVTDGGAGSGTTVATLAGTAGAGATGQNIEVGARIGWSGNLPEGTFAQTITVTMGF